MLASSKAPRRFLLFTRSLLGHFPGGIALIVIIVSVGFTAFTGASGITIIALGGLLLPAVVSEAKKQKKENPISHGIGLVTSAGAPGLLLPPSLPVIVYAITAQLNIDKLYLSTAFPAILLISSLVVFTSIRNNLLSSNRKKVNIKNTHFSSKRLLFSLTQVKWELPLPLLVVGSIYLGLITVTEAATLTAFYVFCIEVFIYREINIRKDLPRIIAETGILVGSILIVVGTAMAFTNVLVDNYIPQQLLKFVSENINHPFIFLLCLNIILIIAGMFLDIFSAIVILAPLLSPLAISFNIHPLHLAVIFLVNLEVGYLTPPIGINLFVARFRFKQSLITIFRATLPFVIVMTAVLLLITYIPAISLLLPNLITSNK